MQQPCQGPAGPQSDHAEVLVVGVVVRNTVVALVVVAVYFCSPGVVLCGHHCHFAGPGVSVYVPSFVSPGSWDFFFCLWGKLGECFCWLCPSVLEVLDVSPFEVDVALGMNAQQQEACILQCLQETLQSLQ